jgi:Domain of unknown function (DUF5666)
MSPHSSPDPTPQDDEHWLDEDSGEDDEIYTARPAAAHWPAPPPWYGGGHGPPPAPRGSRALTVAAVAVVAAGVGAGIVVGITNWPRSSPSPTSAAGAGPTAGSSPAAPAPGASGGNGFLPPGSGGEQLIVAGRVTAVSAASITILGQGNTFTAAITSATKFSGNVHSADGIKVGDMVMLDVSSNGSTNTATSIQDPFTGL